MAGVGAIENLKGRDFCYPSDKFERVGIVVDSKTLIQYSVAALLREGIISRDSFRIDPSVQERLDALYNETHSNGAASSPQNHT